MLGVFEIGTFGQHQEPAGNSHHEYFSPLACIWDKDEYCGVIRFATEEHLAFFRLCFVRFRRCFCVVEHMLVDSPPRFPEGEYVRPART